VPIAIAASYFTERMQYGPWLDKPFIKGCSRLEEKQRWVTWTDDELRSIAAQTINDSASVMAKIRHKYQRAKTDPNDRVQYKPDGYAIDEVHEIAKWNKAYIRVYSTSYDKPEHIFSPDGHSVTALPNNCGGACANVVFHHQHAYAVINKKAFEKL